MLFLHTLLVGGMAKTMASWFTSLPPRAPRPRVSLAPKTPFPFLPRRLSLTGFKISSKTNHKDTGTQVSTSYYFIN